MKPQPGAGRGDVKEKQKHKIKKTYMKEKGKKVFPAFLLDWLTYEDVTDRLTRNFGNYVTRNCHSTLCNITEERRYHLQGRETRSHDFLCNLQLRERIF
jgi:hypothetical protein